ncbi:hypothetical protein CB0940_08910 [Cercospora beticola]|uniref:BTB domain-containing protein n=1 Tax=Cercospora beticola TaxID=122368 RepID=A0A2G5HS68_CERBT|nr:hypothetical protein CB0940_08910 [Cercospora beticola]PIA95072.1 hypothetical protein CB0940_08910 [Cercospora beticola]WPB05505.1 hypothetical protein RHO25_010158 [Cercospora beticola]CAK1365323.1 unnamed protein product [Cercospora beticola]
MTEYPGNLLKLGLKDMLASGLYSDLTIECRGTTFAVHKLVLHTQSQYFRKLLAGGFKEGVAASNISRLPLDEDPNIFSVVIKHLYQFVYDDSGRGNTAPAPFAVLVYAAADMYDIEPLRTQAAKRMKDTIDPNDIDTLIETIRAVDENTADQVLWDIVIPVIKSNMGRLLQNEQFREMLHEMKELNFRLLAMLDPAAGVVGFGKEQLVASFTTSDMGEGDEGDEDEDDEWDPYSLGRMSGHGPGRRLG